MEIKNASEHPKLSNDVIWHTMYVCRGNHMYMAIDGKQKNTGEGTPHCKKKIIIIHLNRQTF